MMLAAPSIRRMPTVVGGGGSPTEPDLTFGSFGLADIIGGPVGNGAYSLVGSLTAGTTAALDGLWLVPNVSSNRIYQIRIEVNGVVVVDNYPLNLYTFGYAVRRIPIRIPAGASINIYAMVNAAGQTMTVRAQGYQSSVVSTVTSIAPLLGTNVSNVWALGSTYNFNADTSTTAWNPIGTALTAAAKGIAEIHTGLGNDASRTGVSFTVDIGVGPDAANVTPILQKIYGFCAASTLTCLDVGPFNMPFPIGTKFWARATPSAATASDAISNQIVMMY